MGKGSVRRTGREVVADDKARAKAARRHDKALARHERLLARARRTLPVQGTVASMGTALMVLSDGADPVWATFAVLASVRLVRAVSTLRHPPPLPQPDPVLTAPPPPPAGSAAWPALHRLDRARDQVLRLSALVGPAGREAAAEAVQAAADADTALRWQAARLAAVEPHRGSDPSLLRPLLDGVACQERLVTALADLVAASDPHEPAGGQRLQDATDALHGLAHGLRQVR